MYVTLSIPKTPNSDFNTAQIVTTCTVGITQHALKGQKLLAQGNGRKQHALKGQKLLAQGIALGIMAISKAPCKGKSFQIPGNIQSFCPYRATGLRS